MGKLPCAGEAQSWWAVSVYKGHLGRFLTSGVKAVGGIDMKQRPLVTRGRFCGNDAKITLVTVKG